MVYRGKRSSLFTPGVTSGCRRVSVPGIYDVSKDYRGHCIMVFESPNLLWVNNRVSRYTLFRPVWYRVDPRTNLKRSVFSHNNPGDPYLKGGSSKVNKST